MSHAFTSGMFVRTPAWHRLGNVIEDWPGSWGEARKHAGLDWEPIPLPVYSRTAQALGDFASPSYTPIPGWQQIARSDDISQVLTIQQESYAVIDNTQLGQVIETVMNLDDGSQLKYETLIVLHGGRNVVCTVYLDSPLSIHGDPSETYRYIVFFTRHDGRGGLGVIFTDIRVVCANTLGMAERKGERDGTSYTIRHTANWEQRVSEMKQVVSFARDDAKAWEELANELTLKKIRKPTVDKYLTKFLPTSSVMTDRQVKNVGVARDAIREILASPTCEHISDTAYGLVMASTEWADHVRRTRSTDSAAARALLKSEPYKVKAVKIAKELIGVK